MYRRVLIPTDGSDGADAAFEHAVDLAADAGAELHVIHAVDPTHVPVEGATDGLLDSLLAAGETMVSELADRGEADGIDVETAVLTGSPHAVITEYAADHDVDLLVMGTHGRTGLDRWLLGSVTERVIRTAPVPVLTVRAADD